MKNRFLQNQSFHGIMRLFCAIVILTFACPFAFFAQSPPQIEWAWEQYEGRTLTHYTSVPYIKSINGVQRPLFGEMTTNIVVSRDNPERPNPNDPQARAKLFVQNLTKETQPNEVPFFVGQRMEAMKPHIRDGKKNISSPPDAYLIYEYPENGSSWPIQLPMGVTPPFPQSQIVIGDAAATARFTVAGLSQEENTIIVPSRINVLFPLTGERISRTAPLTVRWRGGDEGFAVTATLAWDGGSDVTRGQIGKIAERSADGTYSATFSTLDLAHCPDNVRVRVIVKSGIGKWYDQGRKYINSESAAEYFYINIYGAVTSVANRQISLSNEIAAVSPNPVENSATVNYTLQHPTQKLTVEAVNYLGQRVKVAEKSNVAAGKYAEVLDTRHWSLGAWHCVIQTDKQHIIVPLLIQR